MEEVIHVDVKTEDTKWLKEELMIRKILLTVPTEKISNQMIKLLTYRWRWISVRKDTIVF